MDFLDDLPKRDGAHDTAQAAESAFQAAIDAGQLFVVQQKDRTDYGTMAELRFEARERLSRVAPATLGQAARISGVTPADITVLWIYLTGRRRA